jgi:hypothetical protein
LLCHSPGAATFSTWAHEGMMPVGMPIIGLDTSPGAQVPQERDSLPCCFHRNSGYQQRASPLAVGLSGHLACWIWWGDWPSVHQQWYSQWCPSSLLGTWSRGEFHGTTSRPFLFYPHQRPRFYWGAVPRNPPQHLLLLLVTQPLPLHVPHPPPHGWVAGC